MTYPDSNNEDGVLIGEAIALSGELNSNGVSSTSLAYNSNTREYIAVWDFSRINGRTVTSQRFSDTGSLVGENVDLSQSANINVDPVVAYNSIDDDYLVSFRVQEDRNPVFPFNSAVGQLVEADGELIGENFAINNAGFELSLLHNPEVNQYFQTSRDLNFNRIVAQQIDPDGNLIDSAFLDAESTDDAPNGEVALDSINGRYFATWRKQGSTVDGQVAVQGRLIDADGNLISEVLEISQPVTSNGLIPFSSVATEFDPFNTQYLVAYNLSQEQQVRAQLVDADGSLIGKELLLNSGFSTNSVALDFNEALGVYLLVGIEDSELYGQFLTSSGNLLDERFAIDDNNGNGVILDSAVTNDDLDEFVVAWSQTDPEGVLAQRLTPLNVFDILPGTSNQDFLKGNKGTDFIDGRDGDDRLFGKKGNDTLEGGLGADSLYGEKGDDNLVGGHGQDLLFGGNGDDLLDGGADADLLFGGPDADRFILREGDGRDRIFDYRDGQDSLVLAHGLTFEELTINQSAGQSVISITNTSEELASLTGVNASVIDIDDFVLQQDV